MIIAPASFWRHAALGLGSARQAGRALLSISLTAGRPPSRAPLSRSSGVGAGGGEGAALLAPKTREGAEPKAERRGACRGASPGLN